ncbi:hypothetical protein [Prescottella agglutinans]|jgi:hypothetical protein|uniref:Uncharacterized protein n=1 Tax=Prescottella agglutinans TaxID=1644129 RepID=A0ABT6MK28_9NOCA|nr:hypothetical protein [Prescottella agglutinans]MDH6284674.1 hypothetical protein [Prescottella agglutinans]
MTADLPDEERLRRELEMLANVRRRLRDSEGVDFQIPTGAVDQVLDEYNAVRARESGDGPGAE